MWGSVLAIGAEIHLATADEGTALKAAAEKGRSPMIEFLVG
jgi:hypothetical protein